MRYVIFLSLALACIHNSIQSEVTQQTPQVLIVLGSSRDHSVSKKLAHVLQELLGDVAHEVVDLKELPVVDPEKPQNNSLVQTWQNKFQQASAVIFLVPNYNGGYTGVLKNGIDALGDVAAGKNIALIGYSGGYEAQEPVAALMPTLKTLQMTVVGEPVLIPMADSAFDFDGNIKKAELKYALAQLVDTLVKTIKK